MKTPQEEAELQILSIAGTCSCLTKSPEIVYHQKLCTYRLIVERNSLIEINKLLIAVTRAANVYVDSGLVDDWIDLQDEIKALRTTRKVEL